MKQEFIDYCKKYYPKFNIKFKSESQLMKLIGVILFFNKGFMTNFTTTLGNTVYLVSPEVVEKNPLSAEAITLHELVHVHDANKLTRVFFGFLYMFPITFIPFAVASMFFSFWMGIVILALCLSPVPAYFRMCFEKKAYTFSLYANMKLAALKNRKVDTEYLIKSYSEQFTGPAYYFMWPFKDVERHFRDAVEEFTKGNKPYYESEIYDMIDDILANAGGL
jgi:hypothetical protein